MRPGYRFLRFPNVVGQAQIDDRLHPDFLQILNPGGIRLRPSVKHFTDLAKILDPFLCRQPPALRIKVHARQASQTTDHRQKWTKRTNKHCLELYGVSPKIQPASPY